MDTGVAAILQEISDPPKTNKIQITFTFDTIEEAMEALKMMMNNRKNSGTKTRSPIIAKPRKRCQCKFCGMPCGTYNNINGHYLHCHRDQLSPNEMLQISFNVPITDQPHALIPASEQNMEKTIDAVVNGETKVEQP
jgi:hypothetical protein